MESMVVKSVPAPSSHPALDMPADAVRAHSRAADFLTRSTKWLAVVFVVLAIVLAAVAVDTTTGREIDTSLDRTVAPVQDPLAPVAQPGAGLDQPVTPAEPAPATDDPLAGVAE